MSFLTTAMQTLSLVAGLSSINNETDTAQANLEERARVDEFNAKVAEQEAKASLEGAKADATDYRRVQNAQLAASRARSAGSGFVLEGSPLMLDEAAKAEIEFGVQRILSQGRKEADRSNENAGLLRRDAKVQRISKSNTGGAGSLLTIGKLVSGTAAIGSTLATQGVQFG